MNDFERYLAVCRSESTKQRHLSRQEIEAVAVMVGLPLLLILLVVFVSR